jgi:IstB-like ATP binding protein
LLLHRHLPAADITTPHDRRPAPTSGVGGRGRSRGPQSHWRTRHRPVPFELLLNADPHRSTPSTWLCCPTIPCRCRAFTSATSSSPACNPNPFEEKSGRAYATLPSPPSSPRSRPAAAPSACRPSRPLWRGRSAEREQLTYLAFLAELVMAECDDRTSRRAPAPGPRRRLPAAEAAGGVRLRRQQRNQPRHHPSARAGDWIRSGQPLCFIGDSGTGKTHLLIALGTAAAERGYRAKFTLASRLVNELAEAADGRSKPAWSWINLARSPTSPTKSSMISSAVHPRP